MIRDEEIRNAVEVLTRVAAEGGGNFARLEFEADGRPCVIVVGLDAPGALLSDFADQLDATMVETGRARETMPLRVVPDAAR